MKNTFAFLYLQAFFQKMLEEGKITEKEYQGICSANAEILKPDPRYI